MTDIVEILWRSAQQAGCNESVSYRHNDEFEINALLDKYLLDNGVVPLRQCN